ncbi:MAG: small-conductance mechanosensitive channel [Haloquadratum sp. J07HQX50]|nr:MAG: small-conductance mechanosensitive channel [Haloquadratum sp. J07HQX50]
MGVITSARAFLNSLVSTEAQIGVSVLIAALAGLGGLYVLPWIYSEGIDSVNRILENEFSGNSLALRSILRLTQIVVVMSAVLAILVTWGFFDVVVTILAGLTQTLPIASRAFITLLLLYLGFVGSRLAESRLRSYIDQVSHINQHQQSIASRVLQISIFTAVGLTTLSIWQVDLSGLLIGAGFLGIVVGMAARHSLGSLFAGIVLMLSRPFEIGDWVTIGDYEGTVTDITIISTRMQSLDGETIVIPNDNVSNETIINYTDRNRLRLRLQVGVGYGADLERAQDIARKAIDQIENVRKSPKPQVVPTEFGSSAVTLEARFWIAHPNAHKRAQTKATAVEAIKTAYDDAGITIPYPQRTVGQRETASSSAETLTGVGARD